MHLRAAELPGPILIYVVSLAKLDFSFYCVFFFWQLTASGCDFDLRNACELGSKAQIRHLEAVQELLACVKVRIWHWMDCPPGGAACVWLCPSVRWCVVYAVSLTDLYHVFGLMWLMCFPSVRPIISYYSLSVFDQNTVPPLLTFSYNVFWEGKETGFEESWNVKLGKRWALFANQVVGQEVVPGRLPVFTVEISRNVPEL